MNKLRERLVGLPVSISSSELDEIMEIIEEYLEQAFDAGKDEVHLGCGDYEDAYWDWKVWYDEEVNIK